MLKRPFARVADVLLTSVVLVAGAFAQKDPPARPVPDVIVFTNGDQLTGKLVRGVDGSIVFKSEMAGEITVPLDKVKELRSSGSFALLRKGMPVTRSAVRGAGIGFADGKVTLATENGITETVPVNQMGFLIDQSTYDKELARKFGAFSGWNGAVTAGATLVRSTTNVDTYTAGIALVRAMPTVPFLPARNRTTFNLLETYGKQTSPAEPQTVPPSTIIAITSIFHADAERDEYFSPRFFALAQTAFDHNFAQGLKLQAVYGGGIGWTPIKSGIQELDVKMDVHYETQQFQSNDPAVLEAPTQKLIGSTFSEAYKRNLPHKLVFTESGNMLPAWNNSRAYSANATMMIAMPVFKRLGMQFSTTDNYLNDPPPAFKKNSFQFVTGITYNLR